MKDKVLQWCRRERLIQPGEHVVCAVSGGADSVAMLHCLLALREELQISISAAHYNHCLRGEASEEDEAFVRRLCASLDVPLTVGRGDVAARAAETGESLEEAARHLRYGFLKQLPGTLATAHNADDQVETVLLNFLRGTGLKGLCAMEPRQGQLVRPLLAVSRAEIEDYLQANGLLHREDDTNKEDDALRNRLRHHVIPLLKQENPSLSRTVGRMTGLLREDEAWLEMQTKELLECARREQGYDCRILWEAPAVLRRRAIRALLEIPKPAMHHVEAVEALLQRVSGSAEIRLPGGWIARREYDILQLLREPSTNRWMPLRLLPGESGLLPEVNLRISVDGPVFLEKKVDSLSTFAVKYDMMMENPTIVIRPRRTGDQMQLSAGHRSLKRLMIDRKIPAKQRDQLPVLTNGADVMAVYHLGTDVRWAAQPGDRALLVKIRLIRGEK